MSTLFPYTTLFRSFSTASASSSSSSSRASSSTSCSRWRSWPRPRPPSPPRSGCCSRSTAGPRWPRPSPPTSSSSPSSWAPSDRKSTRLNSSHPSISYVYTLSLHDALPIFLNCFCFIIIVVFSSLQFDQLLALAIVATTATALTTAIGMLLSLYCRTTLAATISTYFILFALFVGPVRSEEHTSELQSPVHLVCLHSFPTRRSSDLSQLLLLHHHRRLLEPPVRPAARAGDRGHDRDRPHHRDRDAALALLPDHAGRDHLHLLHPLRPLRGPRQIGRAHV